MKNTYKGPKGILVITKKFNQRRPIGDPLSQAKIYEAQLADELILVDIDRNEESWPILLSTLSNISESLATPITVGGGINKFEQVQKLLDYGADKVLINTGAFNNPGLIDSVASKYGSQCLIVGIDIISSNDPPLANEK